MYFIDWEAAGMEDPFFDVATICNELISTEPDEQYFLHQYFGKDPSLKDQAKILLMRQVSYCYLALHYLIHAVNGGFTLADENIMENIPTVKEWSHGYNTGKFQLANPADFLLYGMTQIKASLEQMSTPPFFYAKQLLSEPS